MDSGAGRPGGPGSSLKMRRAGVLAATIIWSGLACDSRPPDRSANADNGANQRTASDGVPAAPKQSAEPGPISARRGDLAGANVLLVTLDTTRADRIGCYGNSKIDTPALDRLATEGVMFADTIAATPTTLPSHASILTGLYAARHGARANGVFRLEDSRQTLAETLHAAGYRTAAVISAFVLDRRFGLSQGFEYYDDDLSDEDEPRARHYQERKAEKTTDRAIKRLRDLAAGRFFMWVHYFDPHREYEPPSPYAEAYPHNPYDGEIAYVDSQLDRLIAALDNLSVADNTLVVIVGDHGESIGAHGEATHGYLLYQPTLHVPMIMRCGSRLGGPNRVNDRVSQVDIVPTVLSLLGVDNPAETDGLDLTRATPVDRLVFAETLYGMVAYGWAPLAGVYRGDYKYIEGPDPELYNLPNDPKERNNLLQSRRDVAARLRKQLPKLFGESLELMETVRPNVTPSAAELRKLEALGYVGVTPNVPEMDSRPDPKAMMVAMNLAEQAVDDKLTPNESIAQLKAVLRDYPDFHPAWSYLAGVYQAEDRFDEAARALERCVELRPDTPETTYALALVRANQDKPDEAIPLLEQVAARYPDHMKTRYLLGTLLGAGGRYDEAIVHLRAAFDFSPTHEQCTENLIGAYERAGRGAEVEAILRNRLAARPDETSVRLALTSRLCKQQRFADANSVYHNGTMRVPDDGELVSAYALFLATCPDASVRNPDAAIEMLKGFCRRPGFDEPSVALTLASLYASRGRFDEAIRIAERGRALAENCEDEKLVGALDRLLAKLRADRDSQTP